MTTTPAHPVNFKSAHDPIRVRQESGPPAFEPQQIPNELHLIFVTRKSIHSASMRSTDAYALKAKEKDTHSLPFFQKVFRQIFQQVEPLQPPLHPRHLRRISTNLLLFRLLSCLLSASYRLNVSCRP